MNVYEHKNYKYLKWVARWKIFTYTHARGIWWPWVPVLLACAFLIKVLHPIPLADYMMWFSLVMYFGELPLLVMLARRAGRQSIGVIGISNVDKHHVRSGLTHAALDICINDEMRYEDFIVCNLISELASLNKE